VPNWPHPIRDTETDAAAELAQALGWEAVAWE